MFFRVVVSKNQVPERAVGRAFLIEDNWDDWGKFQTQFELIVYDDDGEKFTPGSVKIGQLGLVPGPRYPAPEPGTRSSVLPTDFHFLGEEFFSLGQGETYYETLNALPDHLRQAVLVGLRDCALSLDLFEKVQSESVMQDSLLRGISAENVRNRLHRLAIGDAKLTDFWFEYQLSHHSEIATPPATLTFHVTPFSEPPTNVHVIIGRNGSGKTRCLQGMARAVLGENSSDSIGELRQLGSNRKDWSFAGLIFVSFSAFDNFVLPEVSPSSNIFSTMIGLRQKVDGDLTARPVKTPEQLAEDFSKSFERCRTGLLVERWRSAVATLENDPLFAEVSVTDLLQLSESEWKSQAEALFGQLSSGHAIVLLTITRLVERVDERTLVLLEEPESHLHPPLLSTFIRALADLLIKRNGVGVLSTHSPVVLQEVPKTCVWVLRRSGLVCVAEQPAIETFGENVGILTREVFGLEVSNAGFLKILRKAVDVDRLDYEGVLNRFDGQLGAEAKAIVRGLIADRDVEMLP
jgi:predicted ATPase